MVSGEADVVAFGEVPGWTEHGSGRVVGGTTVVVPTQYKATQLVVALAVWAT